ncbi:MAG: hypothetical protein HPY65_12620 [Syntrophaceae bacterium]|nr:hypothetical protein [Syntrophaceae bacterium]
MKNFAPIVIPTLNRFLHLKNCIDSLSACVFADKTDLYIALDYPFQEDQLEGYVKINDYIHYIHGFNSVNIIKRNKNYGPSKNVSDAASQIFEHHDRLIVSEDDNIFSSDFLRFVNLGLEVYKDREDILTVNGHTDPIDIPDIYKKDVYAWLGFCAWGNGIWKEKWNKINFSEDYAFGIIRKFLFNLTSVLKLNRIANHYVPALIHVIEQNCLYEDVYICLYQFTHNMYSIFPAVSRVRNMGHDGSGLNCGTLENDIYKGQEIYTGTGMYKMPADIKPDRLTSYLLREHWKTDCKTQIKMFKKLLLMRAAL